MTDEVKGMVVTLDRDIREDDVQEILNAILMVKGVVGVTTSILNPDDLINRCRIRIEMRGKIFEALENLKN